ncbi:MAG: hypothetical protein ABR529_10095 [Actinomycetota bacterium]
MEDSGGERGCSQADQLGVGVMGVGGSSASEKPRRGRRGARASVLVGLTAAAALTAPAPLGAQTVAGPSTMAEPCEGSSNPTLYGTNRRMVVTSGGRTLALYDPHGSGQQLTWQDPGGEWKRTTAGTVIDGFFVPTADEALNDRTASIVLARDSGGVEHAWVVYSGYTFTRIATVKLRRLSNLDAPGGPTVGPEVTVEPAGMGNVGVDVAFEGNRATIAWLQRTGDTTYSLVTTWFSDLDGDRPAFHDRSVLFSGSSSTMFPSLAPTPDGMRVLARAGKLRVFSHAVAAPLTQWSMGTAGTTVSGKSRVSAVAFGADILAAVESNTNDHIVKVVRFSSTGSSATTLLTTEIGYADPTIATDGTSAYVVMVKRATQRSVVSRQAVVGQTWSADRVELAATASYGGDYAWPNVIRQTDGYLRFMVDAAKCPTTTQRNAVLAYQRPLSP